jgi:FkbM family methyltransferase
MRLAKLCRPIANALVRRHSLLRPLLPSGYHAYPVPGGRVYLDLRESPMMLARVLRVYEPAKFAAVRRLMHSGGVFVDVGGNKGDFSLVAARAAGDAGRVLCVEPEPENAAWIRRSVARNGYTSVEILPVALADRDGEATLHLGKNSGWHTLVSSGPEASVGELTVPTRTLDGVLAERGIECVDVVKIDVEGAEESVLSGAERTLRRSPRATILLDLHPRRGVDPVAVCARLEAWGYAIVEPTLVLPDTHVAVATKAPTP